MTLLYDESSYEFRRNIYLLTNGQLMPETYLQNFTQLRYTDLEIMVKYGFNKYFAQAAQQNALYFVFKHKQIDKFHHIDMNITIAHFICLAPTKAM